MIACRTVGKYEIANCDEFIVKSFDKSNVKLKCDTMEKNIEISDIAKYFYPAYCITVHRSQGTTFDHPYTIFEWHLILGIYNKNKYLNKTISNEY